MQTLTPDARTARQQLAARGWIPPSVDPFRHLPPPPAPVWLGEAESSAAPVDAAALEDGWTLEALPGTTPGAFDARWLDAADAAERVQLLHGLAAPEDAAAPFTWAHRALLRRGLRVRVAAGANAWLRLQRRACHTVEAPLLVLELQPGARCVLLESHTRQDDRQDGRALVQNLQVHVQLAEGATLQHLRHVAPAAADQVAHHLHARLARGARYRQALLATGSAYHLQRNVFALDGEGAQASAAGVLLAAATALEQQVHARHCAARTGSAAEVLALASGAARVVANAYTHIGAGCDDAETRQRLSGIPTGGQPRLVLRPHLEIHHDQVQAAHGATWGALPEEALFHARQRGLDERSAKALILQGLARATLARVIDPGDPAQELALESSLAAAVARHLAAQGDTIDG
jgi:Fe-S cluster assembly protein SufD